MIPGRSRPSVERMMRLASLLRAGLPFHASEVATAFETSRKTIARDLAFMRDRLGWEIEWDGGRRRYRLIKAPAGPVL